MFRVVPAGNFEVSPKLSLKSQLGLLHRQRELIGCEIRPEKDPEILEGVLDPRPTRQSGSLVELVEIDRGVLEGVDGRNEPGIVGDGAVLQQDERRGPLSASSSAPKSRKVAARSNRVVASTIKRSKVCASKSDRVGIESLSPATVRTRWIVVTVKYPSPPARPPRRPTSPTASMTA